MLPPASMSKFWAGIGVEVIAVGLGVIVTPAWGWIIAFIGLFFFIPAIKEWLTKRKNGWPWSKRWLLGGTGIPPGHTPLQEAARMFYEASKAGKLPQVLAHVSERQSGGITSDYSMVSGSPDNILEWWAGYVSKKLHIYGVRPPSTQHQLIPEPDVKQFSFSEGAEKLKDPVNENVFYTNLTVKTERLQEQYDMEISFQEE